MVEMAVRKSDSDDVFRPYMVIPFLVAPLAGILSLMFSGKETSSGWVTTNTGLAVTGIALIVLSILSMVVISRRLK